MKLIRRVAAVAAFSCSTVVLAGPPAAVPPNAAPAMAQAPKAPVAAEYPLSCTPAARPLMLKAWEAATNSRTDEAREAVKQALAADPKCVMAKAILAMFTPGAEGKKMLDEALTQTAGLTEVEKLDLQQQEATRAGDPEKAYTLAKKLQALAPNVYLLNIVAANTAQAVMKWEEMGAAAKKATELSPKGGAGWNLLGYANLMQHKNDEAVVAFRKYAEVAPTEPNAHDSLGDALLANNQLDEALASYQKAIDVSVGKFWMSYDGVATVKAVKADWDGARAALAKMKESAVEANDKLRAQRFTAWTWLAQGKLPDAVKAIDAAEKEATTARLDYAVAFAGLTKGRFQMLSGKYADALKTFTATEKVKLEGIDEGMKKNLAATRLVSVVEAQARLGKTADAEKTAASLVELYKATPGDPTGAELMAFAQGTVAMAKKDFKGAVESLKKCTEFADLCKLTLAEAQDKAADAAGATETRTALAKANHRDPEYWYAHAQVEAKLKAPGKKVATEAAKK